MLHRTGYFLFLFQSLPGRLLVLRLFWQEVGPRNSKVGDRVEHRVCHLRPQRTVGGTPGEYRSGKRGKFRWRRRWLLLLLLLLLRLLLLEFLFHWFRREGPIEGWRG
jgi:hypothetical protein